MSLNDGNTPEQTLEALSNKSSGSTDSARPKEEPEEIRCLEGVDFTIGLDIKPLTPEEVEQMAEEARAKNRPVDQKYIEQMKKEGVTEDLAIKAFIGLFGGNESEARFFLNSNFYSWTDAPSPIDQLKKAVKEDKMTECVDRIEGTFISWSWGEYV